MFTRDREVVEADVLPEHRGPSAELTRALQAWPGTHYWSPRDGAGRLILILPLARPPRERWWLHALLFMVTFVTVAAGGAYFTGLVSPSLSPPLALSWDSVAALLDHWIKLIVPGTNFAMALMAILLVHECGHYFLAQRYRINASPPYFLPAPYQINFIGTFGAFIRLRSPIADRRQLLDIGAAGPWAGFIVSVVFLIVGMLRSHTVGPGTAGWSFISPVLGLKHLGLGDSLLSLGLRHWFFGDAPIVLHPLALAGWFGVFITGLNLLPLGQLDGGHVLYALIGRRQALVGILVFLTLFPLGRYFFWGWLIWAVLILVVSRGRVVHPSVLDRHRRIPVSRHIWGWATVLLFAVTFTPAPFYLPLPF
jgi:hypothetical protein